MGWMQFQLESVVCQSVDFKWSVVLRQMLARLNYSCKSMYGYL